MADMKIKLHKDRTVTQDGVKIGTWYSEVLNTGRDWSAILDGDIWTPWFSRRKDLVADIEARMKASKEISTPSPSG